jgi:hypothetical protein
MAEVKGLGDDSGKAKEVKERITKMIGNSTEIAPPFNCAKEPMATSLYVNAILAISILLWHSIRH